MKKANKEQNLPSPIDSTRTWLHCDCHVQAYNTNLSKNAELEQHKVTRHCPSPNAEAKRAVNMTACPPFKSRN